MGIIASRARRLQAELRRHLTVLDITREEFDNFANEIADLVLKVFFDELHPLSVQLKSLHAWVDAERKHGLKLYGAARRTSMGKALNPNRLYFLAQPGISDVERRRLWPLQLLLQTAARSARHQTRIAETLEISVFEMSRAVSQAAEHSIDGTIDRYLDFLAQALDSLLYPTAGLQVRLDGQIVRDESGRKAHISPQEAKLLQILITSAGRPVTHQALKNAGISRPVKVKGTLVEKLKESDIQVPIASASGSYTLMESAQ